MIGIYKKTNKTLWNTRLSRKFHKYIKPQSNSHSHTMVYKKLHNYSKTQITKISKKYSQNSSELQEDLENWTQWTQQNLYRPDKNLRWLL